MTKEQVKLINDVVSSVACTAIDPSISTSKMKIHLKNNLRVPSEVIDHCATIVGIIKTEIEFNK